MTPLSTNQMAALNAAEGYGLQYSVAGWHEPGEISTFASHTVMALEKRGLVTIEGPYKKRVAHLTDAGRAEIGIKSPHRDARGSSHLLDRREGNSGRVMASPSPFYQPTED